MDDFAIPLVLHARRLPSPCPVAHVGHIAAKTEWIDRIFKGVNFSIILSGHGSFRHPGGTERVQAPCVLTQWPGARLTYGPSPGTTWHEIYVCFEPARLPYLRAHGLMPVDSPWWPLAEMVWVNRLVDEVLLLARSEQRQVERWDSVCLRLAQELQLARRGPDLSVSRAAIHRLRCLVEARYREEIDVYALADQAGLSASQFRRLWLKEVGMPPHRYMTRLRLESASLHLVESDDPIGVVATANGFPDQLYFTRCFRKRFQVNPSEYRARNRPGRSEAV
ncbi:hypothetical protein LBMAG53_25850 [Planctomycetota bacterium]|nr:hypothetical protein LBMAG53_25850 [Planctomycetota bacterium]